jgi:S-adenosylmethionine decarboxylase
MGETFGLHLMVDGYGCDQSKLESQEYVRRFLDEFPENIGMTKLMSPYVSEYENGSSEHRGLSGFVLIAESHVSIHTFPWEGSISVDVFSCRIFDVRAAEREIVERFGIESIERHVLDRGIEYPINAEIVREIVNAERAECEIRVAGA